MKVKKHEKLHGDLKWTFTFYKWGRKIITEGWPCFGELYREKRKTVCIVCKHLRRSVIIGQSTQLSDGPYRSEYGGKCVCSAQWSTYISNDPQQTTYYVLATMKSSLAPLFRDQRTRWCHLSTIPGTTPPGGGRGVHSGTEGGLARVTYSAEEGVFLRPPHVRDFVKEWYFFIPRYEVWGWKSPYNPQNTHGSDPEWLPKWRGLPSLLPLNRQRINTSKVKIRVSVHPMSVFC